MGFGGQYSIVVGTSITPLISVKPTPIATAIVDAVLRDAPLVPTIVAASLFGFRSNVDSYLRYGRKHFTNGLPEGTYANVSSEVAGKLFAVLNNINSRPANTPLTVNLAILAVPDANLFAGRILQEVYGFTGNTSYAENDFNESRVDLRVPGKGSVSNPWSYEFANIKNDNEVEITFRTRPDREVVFVTQVFNYPDLIKDNYYYQTMYTSESTAHPLEGFRYWTYDPKTKVHSSLKLDKVEVNRSAFLPVAPIVIDGKRLTPELNKPLYTTTKKLLEKITIDMDEVLDTVMDREENPDVDKIESAFINFALNVQSEEPSTKEYIFNFFDSFRDTSGSIEEGYNPFFGIAAQKTKTDWEAFLAISDKKWETPVSNTIVMSDGEYDCVLSFNYIESEEIEGNIGKVGTFSHVSEIEDPLIFGPTSRPKQVELSTLKLRKQLTETTYREVLVHGLMSSTRMQVARWDSRYSRKGLVAFGDTDGQLMIPVTPYILKTLNASTQADLLYEAIVLEIYAEETIYTEWYKTPYFLNFVGDVLTFAAIVSIITTGFDIFNTLMKKGLQAAAAKLLVELIVSAVVVEGIEIIAGVLGPEYTLLIAAVAAVYSLGAGDSAKFKFEIKGVPTAIVLSQLATAGFNAVNSLVKDDFLLLIKEKEEFADQLRDEKEELEKAQDSLGQNVLSPYTMTREPYPVNTYESVDNYYLRTVEDTNPGVRSLDAIESYADNMLVLPTLDNLILGNT